MKGAACMVAVIIALIALVAASHPHVAIVGVPAFVSGPATIRFRVTVDEATENRAVVVQADSGDFYRVSEAPIEGERGPRTSWFEWRDLPSGDYEVLATVTRTDKVTTWYARTVLHVIGMR